VTADTFLKGGAHFFTVMQACSLDIFPSPSGPSVHAYVYLAWYYAASVILTSNNVGWFPPLFLLLFQRCPKNRAPVYPPTSSNVMCLPKTKRPFACLLLNAWPVCRCLWCAG